MQKGGTETGRALKRQVRPTPKRALDTSEPGRGAAVGTTRAARNGHGAGQYWLRKSRRRRSRLALGVAWTLGVALGLNGMRCGAAFKTGRISSNHALHQSTAHLSLLCFRCMTLSHLISEADRQLSLRQVRSKEITIITRPSRSDFPIQESAIL